MKLYDFGLSLISKKEEVSKTKTVSLATSKAKFTASFMKIFVLNDLQGISPESSCCNGHSDACYKIVCS